MWRATPPPYNAPDDPLKRRENGRGGRIRTCDPLLPKQMRYQAALRPDPEARCVPRAAPRRNAPYSAKNGCRTRSPGFAPISSARPARISSTPAAGPFDGMMASELGGARSAIETIRPQESI